MQKRDGLFQILLYQSVGFLTVIALSWVDEVAGLRRLVFGNNPFISDFRESALEMLLVLGVWLLVAGSTRRVLARMRHLESFMRVCSWCRRIDHHGTWMDLEQFMKLGFDTPTTHGICEDCLAKEKAALERARKSPTND